MVIAIVTTLVLADIAEGLTWGLIALGVGLGGGVGAVIARRIPMTAMPQLVAAFHSLVGMAAVLVAAAALNTPDAYGIGTVGEIRVASLVEMSIGSAIGAITFTGSVVAFTKLQGLVSGRPVVFPGQHLLNAALGVLIVVLTVWFCRTESHTAFWLLTLLAFAIGVLIIIPIGGADMPVVVSMLNSYSGWAAAGIGFTLENTALIITGALVGLFGRDPLLHHVQGDEPLVLQRDPRRVRWRDGPFGRRCGRAAPGQAGQRGGRRLHHEERGLGHHRARLRHGGGAGPACAARDGRHAQVRGREGELRHPTPSRDGCPAT